MRNKKILRNIENKTIIINEKKSVSKGDNWINESSPQFIFFHKSDFCIRIIFISSSIPTINSIVIKSHIFFYSNLNINKKRGRNNE